MCNSCHHTKGEIPESPDNSEISGEKAKAECCKRKAGILSTTGTVCVLLIKKLELSPELQEPGVLTPTSVGPPEVSSFSWASWENPARQE